MICKAISNNLGKLSAIPLHTFIIMSSPAPIIDGAIAITPFIRAFEVLTITSIAICTMTGRAVTNPSTSLEIISIPICTIVGSIPTIVSANLSKISPAVAKKLGNIALIPSTIVGRKRIAVIKRPGKPPINRVINVGRIVENI
ncbi:Uncharacterised protein [Streptococcus pneumoniae]|nr:Uncharacterised protein [Streptococcus pneumoniae]